MNLCYPFFVYVLKLENVTGFYYDNFKFCDPITITVDENERIEILGSEIVDWKGAFFFKYLSNHCSFWVFGVSMSRDIFFNNVRYETIKYLVGKGHKLNWHKTFRRRPGRLLNALCTFNLRSVSTGYGAGKFYKVSRNTICKSSHPEVFYKKHALKKFSKSTEKYMRHS